MLSCSVCKSRKHTKRKCPDKFKQVEPQPKRPRGRPRNDEASSKSQSHPVQVNQTQVTAEPARTGRGGRVIRSGRGSRRGRGSTGSKRSRGDPNVSAFTHFTLS